MCFYLWRIQSYKIELYLAELSQIILSAARVYPSNPQVRHVERRAGIGRNRRPTATGSGARAGTGTGAGSCASQGAEERQESDLENEGKLLYIF